MGQRVLQCMVVVTLVLSLVGCNALSGGKTKKEPPAQTVRLPDLPYAAQVTVAKLLAGGQIKKIEKEEKDGSAIYDVEGTVSGKNVEYDIAADGKVLTSEESVPYESLPAAARMAATIYFGTAEELAASKEIEGDKTFYEVQGKKNGATITLKMTDTGKTVEEEKE